MASRWNAATTVLAAIVLLLILRWNTGSAFMFGSREECLSLARRQQRRGDVRFGVAAPECPEEDVPDCVTSPVFRQVYPAMIRHRNAYGHVNIPLGNSDGMKCKTLRRLASQGKLSPHEQMLLTRMGFSFATPEETIVANDDFSDLLRRLIAYEEEHRTNFQIPKKYNPDPELGAWVAMIRRLGPSSSDLPADHVEALNDIGFSWTSQRKCGSSFMKNYRDIRQRLERYCYSHDDDTKETGRVVMDERGWNAVMADKDVRRWISAQREAAIKGNLSEARCNYMDQIPGLNWRDPLE